MAAASVVELMRREWTWRIGAEAAEHHVRWWKYRTAIPLLVIMGVALIGFGFHEQNLRWLIAVAVVPYLGGFLCLALSSVELSRQSKAACEALGLPVASRAARRTVRFPAARSAYLRSCERHGLQPYPFKSEADAQGTAPR